MPSLLGGEGAFFVPAWRRPSVCSPPTPWSPPWPRIFALELLSRRSVHVVSDDNVRRGGYDVLLPSLALANRSSIVSPWLSKAQRDASPPATTFSSACHGAFWKNPLFAKTKPSKGPPIGAARAGRIGTSEGANNLRLLDVAHNHKKNRTQSTWKPVRENERAKGASRATTRGASATTETP